jgi:hypothetical protein
MLLSPGDGARGIGLNYLGVDATTTEATVAASPTFICHMPFSHSVVSGGGAARGHPQKKDSARPMIGGPSARDPVPLVLDVVTPAGYRVVASSSWPLGRSDDRADGASR